MDHLLSMEIQDALATFHCSVLKKRMMILLIIRFFVFNSYFTSKNRWYYNSVKNRKGEEGWND